MLTGWTRRLTGEFNLSLLTGLSMVHLIFLRASKVSVQDLVQLYFSPEVLERKCQQCGDNSARAHSRLVGLPRVFVLYMKRHKFNKARFAGKCKTKVVIPPEISVTDFVKRSVNPPPPVELAQSYQCPGQFPHHPSVFQGSPPPSDPFRVLSPKALMSLSEEEQVSYTMNLSLTRDSGEFRSPTSTKKRKLEDSLRDIEEDSRTPRARSSTTRQSEEPLSPEEEERNFQRALEMSKLQFEEDFFHLRRPSDLKNNNEEFFTAGQPGGGDGGAEEHKYQLQSVVSHHGISANSGHYVADVFRHDVGGWVRYDDQSVTSTSLEAVTSGSNSYNGYIVTYLHKPLWGKLSGNK